MAEVSVQRGQKPQLVDLWVFDGKGLLKTKETAKIIGGFVKSKSIPPEDPIVYLGLPNYAIMNLRNKRLTLFYDQRQHKLLKTSELAGDAETDVNAILTTNFALGARSAENTLGAKQPMNEMTKWAIAVLLFSMVISFIFFYLVITHSTTAPTPQATGSISNAINSSTLIHLP
ncbi:MAG: hypothetical protein QXD11_03055 [Candidatus Micrarchaeaceae archaeon]